MPLRRSTRLARQLGSAQATGVATTATQTDPLSTHSAATQTEVLSTLAATQTEVQSTSTATQTDEMATTTQSDRKSVV